MADPQPVDAGGEAGAWEDFADGDLAKLAAGFLNPDPDPSLDLASAGPAAPAPDAPGGGLVLALHEVIGDGNGEVVFYNEAGLTRLTLQTDAAVVGRGAAPDDAPVDDQDGAGFAYISFESGLTLYYPEGLDLAVAPVA